MSADYGWIKARKLFTADGRSRGWKVDYEYPGQTGGPRHKTIDPTTDKPFATEGAAKAWAAKEIAAAPRPKAAGTVTFGEYLARYVSSMAGDWSQTHKDRVSGLTRNYFEPRWGKVPIASILPSDVELWFAELPATAKIQAPSVAKILHVMRPVFEMAIRDKVRTDNPCAAVKITDRRPEDERSEDVATVAEINRLVEILRNPPPRVWRATSRNPSRREQEQLADKSAQDRAEGRKRAALVLFLYWCGPRWGEAIGITRSDVDFTRHEIRLRGSWSFTDVGWVRSTTKGGVARVVPMPGVVEAALRDHLDRQERRTGEYGDLVFPGERSRFAPRLMRNRAVRESWLDQACADAGLPKGWHPHRFRHSAGSNVLDISGPKDAQDLLGHRQMSTFTDIYGHRMRESQERLRTRMDQLQELSTRVN